MRARVVDVLVPVERFHPGERLTALGALAPAHGPPRRNSASVSATSRSARSLTGAPANPPGHPGTGQPGIVAARSGGLVSSSSQPQRGHHGHRWGPVMADSAPPRRTGPAQAGAGSIHTSPHRPGTRAAQGHGTRRRAPASGLSLLASCPPCRVVQGLRLNPPHAWAVKLIGMQNPAQPLHLSLPAHGCSLSARARPCHIHPAAVRCLSSPRRVSEVLNAVCVPGSSPSSAHHFAPGGEQLRRPDVEVRAGQAPLLDEPAERVGLGPVGVGRRDHLLRVGEAVRAPVLVAADQPRQHGVSSSASRSPSSSSRSSAGITTSHGHEPQPPPDALVGAR